MRRKAGPLDIVRLRESFAHVAMHGDELPLYFYSDLFIKHPEVRGLFPISMAAQRGHLVDALVKIVSQVDSVDELTVFLRDMGDLSAYREVRNRFFATVSPPAAPAVTLVEVSKLYGPDFLIEIEAIAAV